MWINTTVVLLADPKTRKTKGNSDMTTGFCGADLGGKERFAFGLIAFGHVALSLAKYKKFDVVAITGELGTNTWTGNDGEPRETLQCKVDGIAGIKARKPSQHESGKPKERQDDAPPNFHDDAPPQADTGQFGFDDDIPF